MGLKEFYFRDTDDPNYIEDVLETSDELEILIYQIKTVLLTNKGEVLGEYKFGANLEHDLFSFDLNPEGMEANLVYQINTFSETARAYKVEIRYKKITDTPYRDAGLIDVYINDKSFFGVVL